MLLAKDIQVKIPRDEVLRLLKYNKEAAVPNKNVLNLVNSIIKEGRKLVNSKAICRDFLIKRINDNAVVLEGSSFDLLGKSTAHRLWNSKKVTLFVATIGPEVEAKIQSFIKEEAIANAAILDAVGSVAIESVVDYLNEKINVRARKEDFKTVKRFSPGYGDWGLKEQKGLLNLLGASQIGIRLTKGFLMRPEKSVSGIIGWCLK